MLVKTRNSLDNRKKYKHYHYKKDGKDIEPCDIIMSTKIFEDLNKKIPKKNRNVPSPKCESQQEEPSIIPHTLLSIVKQDHSLECYSQQIKEILASLSSDFNINEQDENGDTSLHHIVNTKCIDCFNLIIKFPAISVLIANNKGETVLDNI